MNWFEQIEQKRKLIIGGTVVICLAMLFVTARRNNVSFDSFWHLKSGLDWLENGFDLWRDHFSFTFNGEQIISPPYMFQVLLGWLVTQLGLDLGFEAYKLISFLLTFSLVFFFLHKLRSPVIIYCLVLPLFVVLLQMRAIVRPELISYGLSIIAIILYHRANYRISMSSMLPIVGLMLVWSNYHTPIIGYIIFFGFFTDLALQQIRQRSPGKIWFQWLFWGLAVFTVGFLQPGLNHPVIAAIFFSPEWKELIQEYKPALMYQNVPAIYSLIIIYLVTLALLVRNRQFGLFFICLLLGFYSVTMARLVTPSGIVILCIFAWAVSELDVRARFRLMPNTLSRVIAASVSLVFLVSLTSSVLIARSYMDENKAATLFPEDVADYMINNKIQGNIFNDYSTGGYLIYRLSPDSDVYIDGRTAILYPLDHLFHYHQTLNLADELRSELEKYNIRLAVLSNKQSNYSLAHDTRTLGLDYVGNRFSLFRKNNPNFPALGTILANPACWNAGMSEALEAEQIKAQQILPPNSFLSPSFIQFVIDYTNTTDRTVFLSKLKTNKQWPLSKARFAAYQSLSANLNLMAYSLFKEITDKEFSDYLGAALALAHLGEWKSAEQTLDDATRKTVSFKPTEIKILYELLVQIRQNIALELFDNAYIDQIGGGTDLENNAVLPGLPDLVAFCPEL